MIAGCSVLGGVVEIAGVAVGVETDVERGTGVTAIVLPEGSTTSVAVLGGAPATRETDALRPENLVPGADAILLCGGSAFGLRAADGAMDALTQAGRGLQVGAVRVPIVPAAAIFDLAYKAATAPTAAQGAAAVAAALAGGKWEIEGSVGAGTGATVGKLLGPEGAMKSGQGALTLRCPDGLTVAAVAVVNAVGSVIGADGTVLAGPRLEGGKPLDSLEIVLAGASAARGPGEATTIALVVTDARLDKAALLRVALMAQDGIAQAIRPSHTLWDGDTVFAASAGGRAADPTRVGALAALALGEAIRRGVTLA